MAWVVRSGAAWRSLARGHGGSRGASLALVPLAGMLLTVHQVSDAKVASHLEVETAVCADSLSNFCMVKSELELLWKGRDIKR
ncbi:hypothetical protein EYF80_034202 [Liparis tanakae]|uniref:Uncharacterized protein n=1 Tax=Liparis tanakae TaxID=230148 RepID=A0A4Z2GR69_9TELE|nr:hypothetical protein EYF80_034202 [Liparis tanakae]